MSDFAIFILTNGRPGKVKTITSLKKAGYTGRVYLVVDDLDETRGEYIKKYGEQVIVFDKMAAGEKIDLADNFDNHKCIVFARNAVFDIARKLGVRYFLQLDDDYSSFGYKFDLQGTFKERPVLSMDMVIAAMLKFYQSMAALSIAFAQNGDFIGGAAGTLATRPRLMRKCMNSFFCDTERPFQFSGRINEDVNTYTSLAARGGLFFTVPFVSLNQGQTQASSGGMSGVYHDGGTYIKSFYTVMFSPSCTKVALMGDKHLRLHHRIRWRNAVPVVLSPDHKK